MLFWKRNKPRRVERLHGEGERPGTCGCGTVGS